MSGACGPGDSQEQTAQPKDESAKPKTKPNSDKSEGTQGM